LFHVILLHVNALYIVSINQEKKAGTTLTLTLLCNHHRAANLCTRLLHQGCKQKGPRLHGTKELMDRVTTALSNCILAAHGLHGVATGHYHWSLPIQNYCL